MKHLPGQTADHDWLHSHLVWSLPGAAVTLELRSAPIPYHLDFIDIHAVFLFRHQIPSWSHDRFDTGIHSICLFNWWWCRKKSGFPASSVWCCWVRYCPSSPVYLCLNRRMFWSVSCWLIQNNFYLAVFCTDCHCLGMVFLWNIGVEENGEPNGFSYSTAYVSYRIHHHSAGSGSTDAACSRYCIFLPRKGVLQNVITGVHQPTFSFCRRQITPRIWSKPGDTCFLKIDQISRKTNSPVETPYHEDGADLIRLLPNWFSFHVDPAEPELHPLRICQPTIELYGKPVVTRQAIRKGCSLSAESCPGYSHPNHHSYHLQDRIHPSVCSSSEWPNPEYPPSHRR